MYNFILDKLPLAEIGYRYFVSELGDAREAMGQLYAALDNLADFDLDLDLLNSPLLTKEAWSSSTIEGTQASIDEVFYSETETRQENRDAEEVLNCRRACMQAINQLRKEGKISIPLIKKAHQVLFQNIDEERKSPGEFRSRDVHVGPPGSKRSQASYIPPSADKVPELMDNLIKYIQKKEADAFVQSAIVHAQFELIHPFRDGNGRIGRMLILLFLQHKQKLRSPYFNISSCLERDRDEYFNCLKAISKQNNWLEWIRFYLQTVRRAADENHEQVKGMLSLYRRTLKDAQNATRSRFALSVVQFMFKHPVFLSSRLKKEAEVPQASINRLLNSLSEANVLEKVSHGRGRKPAVYRYTDLLKVIR